MIDPLTSLTFSLYEQKGVYALLLGSGISRTAEIPTGWEITLDLIRRVAQIKNETGKSDWAEWYRQEYGAEPDYSRILDELGGTPDERRSIIHSYIEPNATDLEEGLKTPTKAHIAIAQLVKRGYVKVIITTNFDRLLEQALQDTGIQPTIVSHVDDLKGAIPLIHSDCYLIKLHGDYLDTRILNTSLELSKYPKKIDQLLDRILDEYGLVICGWSANWDVALRKAIQRAPARRYTTFWASRSELGDEAQALADKRSAKQIPIADADSFFVEVQERIIAIEELQRPNPVTTELAIATVKRYLARPEQRIQLHDMINKEQTDLSARLDSENFDFNPSTPTEFQNGITLYENVTERMVRILLVLARWSDDEKHDIFSEVIHETLDRDYVTSGLVSWISLQYYPLVLIYYAIGIGAIRSENYELLHTIFDLPVRKNRHDNQLPAVLQLMPAGSEGFERGLWRQLADFDNRKTPVSDHLFDFFAQFTSEHGLGSKRFEDTFDRFELFAGLAYAHYRYTKEELAAEDAQFWMPFGRAIWRARYAGQLFAEIEEGGQDWPPILAGMFDGDYERLKALVLRAKPFFSSVGYRL